MDKFEVLLLASEKAVHPCLVARGNMTCNRLGCFLSKGRKVFSKGHPQIPVTITLKKTIGEFFWGVVGRFPLGWCFLLLGFESFSHASFKKVHNVILPKLIRN